MLSGYSLLDNYLQYQGAHDSSMLVYKPELNDVIDEERLISENQIGWITITDTDIDFPILQGEDNYEYLNKDPYGEFKLSGSIFLDYRNDPEFNDAYSIIYGHHMEHNAMFGSLDQYQEQSFFDTHRTGQITTKNAVFDLKIFAVCTVDDSDQTVFNPVSKTEETMKSALKERALIYAEPDPEGQIVALATCSATEDKERLIVAGTITKH